MAEKKKKKKEYPKKGFGAKAVVERDVFTPPSPKRRIPSADPSITKPVPVRGGGKSPAGKKYQIGEREVSEEEYRHHVEGQRILAAGGRDIGAEREAKEEAKGFLEERGFFEETRPEKVELDLPERAGAERMPILGPGIAALKGIAKPRSVLGIARDRGWFGIEAEEELKPLIEEPETLREMALQEIQKEVIKEGTSFSEKFGALVESIPVIGGLVDKYATGLIEDPEGNIKTITTEVSKIGNRATNMREKALTGKMGDPYIAYDQIVQMENDLIRMEQRIKLLSIESARLRADGDSINLIEETILDAKQRIFDAKQSAAAGITGSSSDSSIYLTLKELKESK